MAKKKTNNQELAQELQPVPIEKRNWNFYHLIATWIAMDIGIPTYLMASGIMSSTGMSMFQAIITILIANLIIAVPICLNGHAGTKYGIPSPVYWRSAFGFSGASIAAVIRAIVAAGWFGIQIWIGGSALNTVLGVVFPAWQSFSWGIGICFVIFLGLNILVLFKGIGALKVLESVCAPFLVLWMVILLIWAFVNADYSFGPLATQPSQLVGIGAFMAAFIPTLTANVGYWGPLTLNVTDFTRHTKDQKKCMGSIAIGIPTGMVGLALVGSLVTSATLVIFGEAITDPVVLTGRVQNPLFVVGSLLFLMFATLTTNTAANALAPSQDIAFLSGGRLNFKGAVLVLGAIAILIQPWKLMTDLSLYMNVFLTGGSVFLGPIAGICIASYFILNKKTLHVKELYMKDGRYSYDILKDKIKPLMLGHIILAAIMAVLAVAGPSSWLSQTSGLGIPIRYSFIIVAVYSLLIALLFWLRREGGINPYAILSLTLGVALPFLGLMVPALQVLYDAGWFVGTAVGIISYVVLMKTTQFDGLKAGLYDAEDAAITVDNSTPILVGEPQSEVT